MSGLLDAVKAAIDYDGLAPQANARAAVLAVADWLDALELDMTETEVADRRRAEDEAARRAAYARDALADIPGVVSCKIGIEKNLSPADYPMIRLVPSRLSPGRPYSARTIQTFHHRSPPHTPGPVCRHGDRRGPVGHV